MANYKGKKIYIVITDKINENGQGALMGDGNEKREKPTLKDYAKHEFYNLMTNEAQRTVNLTISNIGNFTGNYQTQREIQNVVGHANNLMNLGKSMIAGAAFGPAGMAIAAGTYAVSSLINFGLESASIWVAEKKANYAIDQLRERSGLNTLNDGSRGTEN